VRLTGALFFVSDPLVAQPARLRARGNRARAPRWSPGTQNVISYHVMTRGRLWWALYDGRAPVPLDTGDILVVPRGDSYFLSPDPSRAPTADRPSSRSWPRWRTAKFPFVMPRNRQRPVRTAPDAARRHDERKPLPFAIWAMNATTAGSGGGGTAEVGLRK